MLIFDRGEVLPKGSSTYPITKLHPSGLESQPLQQNAPGMTVDFDAVFGNKAAPANDGTQPAAGKALYPSHRPGWKLKTFGFVGRANIAFD